MRGTHMRLSNNRSVMPLYVRGRTRATMKAATCVRTPPERVGEPAEPPSCEGSGLVILPVNEEFPVSASHQLALIKSLPFVHTARRYYQSEALVRPSDCSLARHGRAPARQAVTARMHACTHARTHARTCTMPPARGDTATARGNARRREVPAGCARAAALAASPGVRFKELCPKAASPAGPHVPFCDTSPPPQARGLPNKQQASAASFHFGVRSFADDPSLSGGILVGRGGAQGRGMLGWGLGGLLTCSDVPCVLLMWMT